MKLKDLFSKKTKINSEKVSIKIDKKQLEKITGGATTEKNPIVFKTGGSSTNS